MDRKLANLQNKPKTRLADLIEGNTQYSKEQIENGVCRGSQLTHMRVKKGMNLLHSTGEMIKSGGRFVKKNQPTKFFSGRLNPDKQLTSSELQLPSFHQSQQPPTNQPKARVQTSSRIARLDKISFSKPQEIACMVDTQVQFSNAPELKPRAQTREGR